MCWGVSAWALVTGTRLASASCRQTKEPEPVPHPLRHGMGSARCVWGSRLRHELGACVKPRPHPRPQSAALLRGALPLCLPGHGPGRLSCVWPPAPHPRAPRLREAGRAASAPCARLAQARPPPARQAHSAGSRVTSATSAASLSSVPAPVEWDRSERHPRAVCPAARDLGAGRGRHCETRHCPLRALRPVADGP